MGDFIMKTDDFKQFINDDKGQKEGEMICCLGIFLIIASIVCPPVAPLLIIFAIIIGILLIIF